MSQFQQFPQFPDWMIKIIWGLIVLWFLWAITRKPKKYNDIKPYYENNPETSADYWILAVVLIYPLAFIMIRIAVFTMVEGTHHRTEISRRYFETNRHENINGVLYINGKEARLK